MLLKLIVERRSQNAGHNGEHIIAARYIGILPVERFVIGQCHHLHGLRVNLADIHTASLTAGAALELFPDCKTMAKFMGDAVDIILTAVHIGKEEGGVQRINQGAEGHIRLGLGGLGIDEAVGKQILITFPGLQRHLRKHLGKAFQRILPISLRSRGGLSHQIDISY